MIGILGFLKPSWQEFLKRPLEPLKALIFNTPSGNMGSMPGEVQCIQRKNMLSWSAPAEFLAFGQHTISWLSWSFNLFGLSDDSSGAALSLQPGTTLSENELAQFSQQRKPGERKLNRCFKQSFFCVCVGGWGELLNIDRYKLMWFEYLINNMF